LFDKSFEDLIDIEDYTDKELEKIQRIIEQDEDENPLYELELVYRGQPKAAPRPKVNRANATMYDPGQKDKKMLKSFIIEQLDDIDNFKLIEGEIDIELKIYIPMIKSIRDSKVKRYLAESGKLRPLTRPDIDNYEKTVYDAINGVVFVDDSQIVDVRAEKYYSIIPRIEIKLTYREKPLKCSINKKK